MIHRYLLNTLRPRQNGRHFADDIFKCIFSNENVWISLKIKLKSVPKVRINNIPALVQIMAWCRLGGKPLSEPMMGNSLTHICVTRPQWINCKICNLRNTTNLCGLWIISMQYSILLDIGLIMSVHHLLCPLIQPLFTIHRPPAHYTSESQSFFRAN